MGFPVNTSETQMLSDWWIKNGLTLAFYVLVIALLIVYRKKFEFQGIAALRRTKFGLKFIDKYAEKHRETTKILGYIGVGIGFAGMIFIVGYVLKGLYNLIFLPQAPATLSLVLPGVNIPGAAIHIPLWVLIPLFIVVVIHESGHGLVAKAFNIPVKNTGIVFFGPLAGAFVEPDEEKLNKAPDIVKYSVYAAGPFANALTAIVVIILLLLVINPLTMMMVTPMGFSVSQVQEGYPAAEAGWEPGTVYTMINNMTINSSEALTSALSTVRPGETLTISNSNQSITLVTAEHPQHPGQGYLGVIGVATDFDIKDGVPEWLYYVVRGLYHFLFWIFTLSVGLGAFNLLPLGPVDGGRMIQLAFGKMYGDKKGHKYWAKLGWVLLIIILTLIIVPILRSAF